MTDPCEVCVFDGVTYWRRPGGAVVARREGAGRAEDVRALPPFLQILPCPYCGVSEDRSHDPLKHIDPRLGTRAEVS